MGLKCMIAVIWSLYRKDYLRIQACNLILRQNSDQLRLRADFQRQVAYSTSGFSVLRGAAKNESCSHLFAGQTHYLDEENLVF